MATIVIVASVRHTAAGNRDLAIHAPALDPDTDSPGTVSVTAIAPVLKAVSAAAAGHPVTVAAKAAVAGQSAVARSHPFL
jgi:hypothetical protein